MLRAGGPVPPSRADSPMVIDTDVGGDPDDAVALVVAAMSVPELSLVVTSDEAGGERARFARYLLDLCGRPDVPVVAGRQLRDDGAFTAVDLVPPTIGHQPTGLVAAVERACSDAAPVRWVGMGPLSNLAEVLKVRPHLASGLVLTQMGGAVRYREPSRAEHNIRLDPEAARAVLARVRGWLVTSDVTFHPAMEVDGRSPLYRGFASPRAPVWAQVLRGHLDQWFARYHPGSMQHDALTLSAALQLPFVDFDIRRISFDPLGRMSVGEGMEVFLSHRAHYAAFFGWLERQLFDADGNPEPAEWSTASSAPREGVRTFSASRGWPALRRDLVSRLPEPTLVSLDAAVEFAVECHRDQTRPAGEPYLEHLLEVLLVLVDAVGVEDVDVLRAAVLHDTVEDTPCPLDEIRRRFGANVATLVDWVTKPEPAEGEDRDEIRRAYLRRLRDAPSDALIVKLADRLSNVQRLDTHPLPAKRRRYYEETVRWIVPFAHRHPWFREWFDAWRHEYRHLSAP